MKMNHTIKAVALSLICAMFLTSCGGCGSEQEVEPPAPAQDPKPAATTTAAPSNDQQEEKDPNALPEGMMRSYLSGLPVDEKIGNRRPVAIMLNNLKPAQPMSGVSYADVVYEYVVEGAITRLMGLFENYDDLDKIGSVRSCREYFVYTALEFDAIYCHFGQASYAVELLDKDYVDNINGLGPAGDVTYYRTTDRQAPHNVYTSKKGIDAGLDMLGYRRDHYEG